ncbi:TRAP transporter small permease [Paroceanicella profunda]|uniref:TRAP transporter small permease n=1 Tax=Paroceanicella profunda TaxID=2579971 RepID=UPI001478F6EA|nr:TRAP transporter small permease [Paroceanicella profunda]
MSGNPDPDGDGLAPVHLGAEPGLGPIAIVLKLFVALVVLFLAVLTCVDVTGRYFFNHPVSGASELTEFGMGLLIFGGLPLVTARREHVSIDLLDIIVGVKAKGLQTVVMLITSIAGLGLMCWRLWLKGDAMARYSDTSIFLGVPLAPFAWFMSVMAGVAVLALVVQIVLRLGGRNA